MLEPYLFRGVLVIWEPDHLSCHLVDGADYLQHLVVGDVTVLVDVVQLKRPCSLAQNYARQQRDGSQHPTGHTSPARLDCSPAPTHTSTSHRVVHER